MITCVRNSKMGSDREKLKNRFKWLVLKLLELFI